MKFMVVSSGNIESGRRSPLPNNETLTDAASEHNPNPQVPTIEGTRAPNALYSRYLES